MSDELLPCPFCGGVGYVPHRHEDEGFAIQCNACDCESFGLTAEEAMANWNRRTPGPESARLRDAGTRLLADLAEAGFRGAIVDRFAAALAEFEAAVKGGTS